MRLAVRTVAIATAIVATAAAPPRPGVEGVVRNDPTLRQLDLAAVTQTRAVRRMVPRSLLAAYDARERSWRTARIARCPALQAKCLAETYRQRAVELTVLASRLSNGGPAATDLHAYTLAGQWRVTQLIDPNGGDAGALPSVFDRLPKIGSTVSGRPGQICIEISVCRDIGWERRSLSALPDGGAAARAALALPPATLVYTGTLYDRNALAITLFARPDGHIFAEQELCNADARKVERTLCDACHTMKGGNALIELTRTWTDDQLRLNIAKLQHTKAFMPPFAGNADDVEALAQLLRWETKGAPPTWPMTTTPPEIATYLDQAGVK